MRPHRFFSVFFSVVSLALVILCMAAIWLFGMDPEPKKQITS
jgi:hypothetical protein